MPKTSLSILFGKNNLDMRGDVSISVVAGGEQPLFLASDLANENSAKPYITLEQDYWLLDGTYKFIPDEVQVGWMSTSMSDSGGSFGTSPQLQFDFTDYQTIVDGMTLYFGEATGDYPDEITIKFTDTAATASSYIQLDTYYPTGTVFSTDQPVADFDRIQISFLGTNNAYRYARLFRIDFDTTTRWSGSNVRNGKLVEEVDPLSLRMTSNQIEFSLFSDAGEFSITDPQGEYASLQDNEPIEAYEQIGDQDIFLGRFYLDDWDSLSENEARFTALDAIGLMDKIPHYNPHYSVFSIDYTEDMIDHVMQTAGINYDIDASLTGISVSNIQGLPIMSCRDALLNMLVFTGGYATCARSRIVNIVPFELASDLTSYDWILTAAEKGQESPVRLKKAVTSVKVKSHQWSSHSNSDDIYDETLATGAHLVAWDHFSFYGLGSSTATYTLGEYGADFIKLTVTSSGTFVISESEYYTDIGKEKTIDNTDLPSTTPVNVIHVSDALLIIPTNLDTITQRIYDYYLQRFVQKTKLYAMTIKAGDSVLIDTLSNKKIQGIVERVEIDLTGGFISDIDIVGVLAA